MIRIIHRSIKATDAAFKIFSLNLVLKPKVCVKKFKMVKSFLLAAIAVFCIIQVAQCRVAKKSVEPEVESTDISVSDIAKQAEDAILSVHSKFLEFWGVKNNDELSTLVQTQSKTYTEKLATLVKDIAEEVGLVLYKLSIFY